MAQLVRDDLLAVMALREDLAFLRGDGLANTPVSMASRKLPKSSFMPSTSPSSARRTPGGNCCPRCSDMRAVDISFRPSNSSSKWRSNCCTASSEAPGE